MAATTRKHFFGFGGAADEVAKSVETKPRALGYRPELDGIRAISCLLVLLHHAHVVPGWPAAQVWASWFQGWIGVDVFFVLSGFLITSILIEEERKFGYISLKNFYIRREFRIVPAYYVAIAVYGLFTLFPLGIHFAPEFRSHVWKWLLYLGGNAGASSHETGLLDFAWSLRIEQRFYVVWPVLFFCLTKSRRIRLFLLFGCFLAFFGWRGGDVSLDRMRSYYGLLEGCVVALLYKQVFFIPALERWFKKIPTGLTVLPILAAYAGLFLNKNCALLFSFAVAIFLYSLNLRNSPEKGVLAWPPLVWLGQRSYSFYLFHMVVLRVAMGIYSPSGFFGSAVMVLIAAIATTAASACMFILVEEPMRKLGKRLTMDKGRRVRREVATGAGSSGQARSRPKNAEMSETA
jgi:peptidoglycan/LPS O-acetylase OafA/YrhL